VAQRQFNAGTGDVTYHPDPILNAALTRQAELQQEVDKLSDFISTYRALAKTLSTDTGGKLPGTNGGDTSLWMNRSAGNAGELARVDAEKKEEEANQDAPPRRTRVTDNPKPAAVVKAAVALVREMQRPLTRREIHRGLEAMGLEVKGADPVKTLGTMLWRSGSEQLIQLEGLGYWLKDEDYEPAGYYALFGLVPKQEG
jgi:hypothetical protein